MHYFVRFLDKMYWVSDTVFTPEYQNGLTCAKSLTPDQILPIAMSDQGLHGSSSSRSFLDAWSSSQMDLS